MKIARYSTHSYMLPLKKPLPIGEKGLSARRGQIVEYFDEANRVGRGDIAPLPGFSSEGISLACEQAAVTSYRLTKRGLPDGLPNIDGGFKGLLEELDLQPSVRFGIEAALLGLAAAQQGVSLARLINPESSGKASICGLITGGHNEAVARAETLRAQGFTTVKLKVGGKVDQAVETTKAVRAALGDDAALRLDANATWRYKDALAFCKGVSECNIEYFEEPLSEAAGLLELSRDTGVPMALDETLLNVYPDVLPSWKGIRAIVLKPTIVGGIARTLHFAQEAEELGITPVISASYESGVGLACLANLAAAIGGGAIPAGLDTYDRLAMDVLAETLPTGQPEWDIAEINRRAAVLDYGGRPVDA